MRGAWYTRTILILFLSQFLLSTLFDIGCVHRLDLHSGKGRGYAALEEQKINRIYESGIERPDTPRYHFSILSYVFYLGIVLYKIQSQ
ncbi:hypothetical protein BJ166DRAFT_90714 [Pestalotiopsis sp. NC0098]|nr:hypothetical protein BJ166DRAFT_90714 [Pestalotiopsis sp. NC0098]